MHARIEASTQSFSEDDVRAQLDAEMEKAAVMEADNAVLLAKMTEYGFLL